MYVRCGTGLLAIAILGTPSVGIAQTRPPALEVAVAHEVRPLLQVRKVTVKANRVSLAAVIDDIIAQGQLRVSYSPAILPADKMVTITLADIAALDALEQVLLGTGIQIRTLNDGELALVKPAVSPGKHQGVITGKIVHAKTKAPLAGIVVSLGNGASQVTTDRDGTFRLTAEPGEHTLQIRGIGFVRQAKQVTVTSDQAVTVDVALDPSASVLDEVIVTGTVVATERRAIPTPITVITAEDIEKRGITRIEEFFRGEVPGVLALERGIQRYNNTVGAMQSTAVLARGRSVLDTGASPLKTYVDGVELADPSYLGTIDPQSIERIEIITGPQAATIYGAGAMGGVMQIFLKKGNGRATPDFTMNVRYGMLENNFSTSKTPSHRHTLSMTGGTGPAFSYSVNGSYQYSGQWQPMLFNQGYGGSIGATHTSGPMVVSGSLATNGSRNGTINAATTASDGWGSWNYSNLYLRTGIEDGELYDRYGYNRVVNQQISASMSQTVSLNVDYRPFAIWQHHVSVGRSQVNARLKPLAPNFQNPTDTLFQKTLSSNSRTSVSYNTTWLPRWTVTRSTLTFGADGSWGTAFSSQGCTPDAATAVIVGCWTNSIPGVSQSDNRSLGGFASWQLGVFDKIFLTAAARWERNPNYGRERKINWTPRYGATYTIEWQDWSAKLLASYGRVTRSPQPDQRREKITVNQNFDPSFWIDRFESPELGPEHSYGPQGGIELYYGNRGSFTITRYVQYVVDMIQPVIVDSVYVFYPRGGYNLYRTQSMYLNTASIRQHGWEGTGSLNAGPFRLQASMSWNDSRVTAISPRVAFTGFAGIDRPGTSALGQPTHMGNVQVAYAHGNTNVSWGTNFVGASLQRGAGLQVSWNATYRRLPMYGELSNNLFGVLVSSPGYAKSNLAASHRLTPWASATMNVTNLTNNYGSDAEQLSPSLGRQTLLGLSLRFPRR